MTSAKPAILVIEDEPQMLRFLRTSLSTHAYRVLEAQTARDGLARAAEHSPDVILLDLGLPDQDGLEVTARLRGWSQAPVIVISARGRDEDKIEALDRGADDYLTKPFSVGELLARIRVALRHQARAKSGDVESVFTSGALRVDFAAREVRLDGAPVHLTPTEYELLGVLIRHAGRVVTHRQLLTEVWGPEHLEDAPYLRVFMGHLRQKLEADPARPRLLLNEPGVGYRLKAS